MARLRRLLLAGTLIFVLVCCAIPGIVLQIRGTPIDPADPLGSIADALTYNPPPATFAQPPLPPGATNVQQSSQVGPPGVVHYNRVTYDVSMSRAAVYDYYKNALTGDGWSINTVSSQPQSQFGFMEFSWWGTALDMRPGRFMYRFMVIATSTGPKTTKVELRITQELPGII